MILFLTRAINTSAFSSSYEKTTKPLVTPRKMTDEIEQSPALDKQHEESEATPAESQNATESGDASEHTESADKADQVAAAHASGAFDPYNLPEHARMPFPPPPGFPHPMHSTHRVISPAANHPFLLLLINQFKQCIL